jgi:adenosylmethionine-8-amino-7-oxononanoate aminotransferase
VSAVFERYLDLDYPCVVRGEAVRLYLDDGREILDACSGGAMVACLGHGLESVIARAAEQAERLSYVYFHHFTNEPQERLAERFLTTAAPELARVRFTSGGSEANEMALRLVRQYHVDRGEAERWRVISPAQAYHGSTLGTLALPGRPALQHPFGDYLAHHLHIPPGDLDALDRVIEEAGPETIAAFFCEPISAAAYPAYSPSEEFWIGLDERRRKHGFLVCFDEIVTGMGRTGSWFAYQQLPLEPDIVSGGKGLGAGYAPLAAVICAQHVYDALANGSREFEHGHTWDGAPLSCAVGLAVLDEFLERGLVERVRERGPSLREELEAVVGELDVVAEVRGRGFLLGIELRDPRDGSFLSSELHSAELVDDVALDYGVLVTSTNSAPDGYTGHQTLLAPAYTSGDDELGEMVSRVGAALTDVDGRIKELLT